MVSINFYAIYVHIVLTFLDSSNESALEAVSKLSIVADVFCDNQTITLTLVFTYILYLIGLNQISITDPDDPVTRVVTWIRPGFDLV